MEAYMLKMQLAAGLAAAALTPAPWPKHLLQLSLLTLGR